MDVLKNFLQEYYFEATTEKLRFEPLWLFHSVPVVSIVLYCIMLYFLPGYLIKTRKNEDKKSYSKLLTFFMFCHNLSLSFVSGLILFIGTPMYMKKVFFKHGWFHAICDPDGVVPAPAMYNFWGMIYYVLKYVELFDTFFLIYKNPKRKVNFLHWYHHITVLIFGHLAFTNELSCSYLFGLINLIVHIFMYYYYARAITGKRPSWGIYLTVGQIVQMFVGMVIISFFSYYVFTGRNCHVKTLPVFFLTYAYLMYGSYLYLFCEFFYKRYVSGKKSKKEKKGK